MTPSELEKLYWVRTTEDFRTKIRLYVSEKHASFVQDLQTLGIVARQLFGTDEDQKKPDNSEIPQTAEQLQSAFAQVFGKG